MAKKKKQLEIPPRAYVIITIAILVGASMGPFREYQETGSVSSTNILASLVAIGIGVVIVCGVIWWAKR